MVILYQKPTTMQKLDGESENRKKIHTKCKLSNFDIVKYEIFYIETRVRDERKADIRKQENEQDKDQKKKNVHVREMFV